MQGKEYIGLSHVSGPIIIVEGVSGVGFDEMVEIIDNISQNPKLLNELMTNSRRLFRKYM